MKQFVDAYKDIQAKTLQGTLNVPRTGLKRLITKLRADSNLSTGSGLGATRPPSVQSPLSSPQSNALLALPTPSPLALESSTASSMSSFELPGPAFGTGNGHSAGRAERAGEGNENVGVGVDVGGAKERQRSMKKAVSATGRVLGAAEGAGEKRVRPPPTSIMSAPTTPTGANNWLVKELPAAPKWANSSIVRAADEAGVHWLTIKNAVYIKRILEVCTSISVCI